MSADKDGFDGGCLCGAVRYHVSEAPRWGALCHCRSCRKHSGAVVVPFIGVARSALSYTGDAPQSYQSSPGVTRSFCGRCGSPITFATDERPHEIDIFVGTLDAPERFPPQFHVHTAERVAWVVIADGLPQHAGSSASSDEDA